MRCLSSQITDRKSNGGYQEWPVEKGAWKMGKESYFSVDRVLVWNDDSSGDG